TVDQLLPDRQHYPRINYHHGAVPAKSRPMTPKKFRSWQVNYSTHEPSVEIVFFHRTMRRRDVRRPFAVAGLRARRGTELVCKIQRRRHVLIAPGNRSERRWRRRCDPRRGKGRVPCMRLGGCRTRRKKWEDVMEGQGRRPDLWFGCPERPER